MRAMRAEGFSGYKDLKLVDIPSRKPRMDESGKNHSGWGHAIRSHHSVGGYPRAKAPLVLGGEGAGVVEEGGEQPFLSVHV